MKMEEDQNLKQLFELINPTPKPKTKRFVLLVIRLLIKRLKKELTVEQESIAQLNVELIIKVGFIS